MSRIILMASDNSLHGITAQWNPDIRPAQTNIR